MWGLPFVVGVHGCSAVVSATCLSVGPSSRVRCHASSPRAPSRVSTPFHSQPVSGHAISFVYPMASVIFLDIDGVLDSFRKRNHLDETKLALLTRLTQETQSKVVISSHWRLVQPLHSRLRAVLRYSGIEVIGSTPVHPPSKPRRPP